MKQIGLSFRLWSGDHQGQFPFNASTNIGGTLEFCQQDGTGFDQSMYLHLMVVSNELSTPKILVCPADAGRKPATIFNQLKPENITYGIRTGTNINANNRNEIVAVCPIHGHTLTVDGTVHLKGKL